MDHSTLNRWVLAYAPLIERRLRTFRKPHGGSIRVDETYIKRIEADPAQAGPLINEARERAMARRSRRLAGPGQRGCRRALLGLQQRIGTAQKRRH